MHLQAAAAERGIIIAPGPVFAAGNRYKHHLRLNCGFPWSDRIAGALRTLGELASRLASEHRWHETKAKTPRSVLRGAL
jgi:DNA-binding transcriptional MocR family regulator